MRLRLLHSLSLLVWVASGTLWGKPLASLGAERSFHLVSEVKGEVWVLRGSRKPWRLVVGADLRSTDKLKLGNSSAVRVRCQNLVRWRPKTVGVFSVEQGCGMTGPMVLKPTNADRSPTRGGDDPTRPYLIGPRETKIVDSQPLLRWNPVAGMPRYRVEVSGPGVDWTTEVIQPQVRYSGTQVFQPGMRYRVKIQGRDEGPLSNDPITGFSLLDRKTVAQVNAELAVLQRDSFSSEAAVLELAHVERSYELYGSAIDRLEPWLSQGNKSAAGYQLLGDLYRQVGLHKLARERYITGLLLMQRDGNLAGQAAVLESLGQVDLGLVRRKEALDWFEAAHKAYQNLGDGEQVQAVEKVLVDLKGKI
jgi:hypothetical protein